MSTKDEAVEVLADLERLALWGLRHEVERLEAALRKEQKQEWEEGPKPASGISPPSALRMSCLDALELWVRAHDARVHLEGGCSSTSAGKVPESAGEHEMAAVYLAGRYGRRDELRVYAMHLRDMGHTVTSRWLEGDHDTDGLTLEDGALESERRRWAEEDLADLRAARVLIAFSEGPDCRASRGGRHVELGVALAERKRTIVVGPRENVFMCLPAVEWYGTWQECLAALVAE